MGVWIETQKMWNAENEYNVTPCMGVWIETPERATREPEVMSHPVWVCGLKRLQLFVLLPTCYVTPCMGVWIETLVRQSVKCCARSHPVWVCGLKQSMLIILKRCLSHTLYGCVD